MLAWLRAPGTGYLGRVARTGGVIGRSRDHGEVGSARIRHPLSSLPGLHRGDPCGKPAAHKLLVFRRDGRVVARVETRADGTYRVMLAPGRYGVVAPQYRRGVGVTPRTVFVRRAKVTRIDLEIDTGIQ